MPRNSSGIYSLPQPPFVSGTVISSAAMNSDLSDIAAALTGSLPTNGQTGMIGQLKLADGSTVAPSISFSNETNTGFFRPGTGEIGVVIQGVQVAEFAANGLQGQVNIGTVVDFAGPTAPPTWYFCYGQNVSRTTYSALFAVIGTTFGSGDGATTFGLPDFRGNAGVGVDNMGGVSGGRFPGLNLGVQAGSEFQTLSPSNLPSHTHNYGSNTGTESVNHSHSGGVTATTNGGTGSIGGNPFVASITVGQTGGDSVTHFHSYSGTTDGGTGSNTSFSIAQPTLGINKMIYAAA